MWRSASVCKISFLPVVLKLSPGMFNNSALAVPGDLPGRQYEAVREDTYSFSQSDWGRRRTCGELQLISATRWSPFVLLLLTTVSCFYCLYYFMNTFTVLPSFWHLKLIPLSWFTKAKWISTTSFFMFCWCCFLLHQALMSITWTLLHAMPASWWASLMVWVPCLGWCAHWLLVLWQRTRWELLLSDSKHDSNNNPLI